MPARVNFTDAAWPSMPTARWHRPRSSWPSSGSRSTRGDSRGRDPAVDPHRRGRARRALQHAAQGLCRARGQGYATTRHGSGTVAHVRDAAGSSRRAAHRGRRTRERARRGSRCAAGGDGDPGRCRGRQRRAPPPAAPRPSRSAPRCARPSQAYGGTPAARTFPPVLPPDVMRGSYVGLVTGDAALVARAREEAARRGVRLRVAGPDDGQTLGDLVLGLRARDRRARRARRRDRPARAAQRARSARDGVASSARRQVTRRPSLSSQRSMISDALCPPKPNPLERPTRMSTPSLAVFGT